jgi:enoyl-CoA hydratase/carnithine racemase
MGAPVLSERAGGIVTLTLNRPETGNRIDDDMASALRAASQEAAEDDSCRVVLLMASGPSFSLGAAPLPSDGILDSMRRRRLADAVAAIPVPVIAVLQGEVRGQGLELALACDIRLAAEEATLAMDQVLLGQVPWDGGTQRLPRIAPKGVALELVLTGREVPASEALDIGLVSACLPAAALVPRARELAAALASMAPIAAAYAKEAVMKGMDMPLDQGVRLETDLAILLHSTSDRVEGIRSFLEKRRPRFTGA